MDHSHTVAVLRHNHTLRENMDDVMGQLTRLHSLGQIGHLARSKFKTVLEDDVMDMTSDIRTAIGQFDTSMTSSQCINDTGRLVIDLLHGKPWALQSKWIA